MLKENAIHHSTLFKENESPFTVASSLNAFNTGFDTNDAIATKMSDRNTNALLISVDQMRPSTNKVMAAPARLGTK